MTGVGKVAGFSLHAGVAARADQRQKLERLCRYISRPAIAEQRRSLTTNRNVQYRLKTPYRNGTTRLIFESLDFIAQLAALWKKRGPPYSRSQVFCAERQVHEPKRNSSSGI
jgi:hypothetical protein